jgi:hypothetical protein
MRLIQLRERCGSHSGQSLLETALLIPVVLLIALNAINLGYYAIVCIHLASAPREGVEYSIQGSATPSSMSLPDASGSGTLSVSTLAFQDMVTLKGSSSAKMRICSVTAVSGTPLINPGATNQTTNCASFNGAATFSGPDSDPESPLFTLNRVDVQYTVTPLIPGSPFGILTLPNYNFHRQVSMRAIN